MKELVLLTGASSGIGYEMANLLAKEKFDLILVARSIEKLESLKAELNNQFGITVYPMQVDLSNHKNAIKLYDDIKERGLNVTMLINNAGFGGYGNFIDIPLETQVEMINVNITSLTVLCHLFLKDMKATNHGRVMNIASLLSYLPFPFYSVYSATKTFVLSFTETLAAEFADTDISITSLCPGPVDTAFTTPEMLNTNAYKSNKPMPSDKVAAIGVKHLLTGKGNKLVGFQNWFISNLPRLTPDSIMMKIKQHLASQRKTKVNRKI